MQSKHTPMAVVSVLALAVWMGIPPVVGVVGVTSCAGTTQIIVTVETDACATVWSTDIVSAPDEQSLARATTPQASQQGCAAAPQIGTAVFVPDGSNDQEIVVRVTTGISKAASLCKEGDDGCIVAKRKARFVPNETVRVLVTMTTRCAKVVCAVGESCDGVTGKCAAIPGTNGGGGDDGGADTGGSDATGIGQDAGPRNGCDATGCVWQCDAKTPCTGPKCEAGKPCTINCIASNACNDVSCGDASSCDVLCKVDNACKGTTRCGNTTGACNIQCATESACDGDMSCNCSSSPTPTCNITCTTSSCGDRKVCCCKTGQCKIPSQFSTDCGG